MDENNFNLFLKQINGDFHLNQGCIIPTSCGEISIRKKKEFICSLISTFCNEDMGSRNCLSYSSFFFPFCYVNLRVPHSNLYNFTTKFISKYNETHLSVSSLI